MSYQYQTLTPTGTKVLADCPSKEACQVAKELLEMPAGEEPGYRGRIVEIGECSQCHEQKPIQIHNFRGITLNCCDDCVC